jgi:ABC-type nitrate/sulfonate/bicarbonate transport system permease component
MPSETVSPASPPGGTGPADRGAARHFRDFLVLRGEIPLWQSIALGILCVGVCFGLWWFVTRGPAENRIVSYSALPSPRETFGEFDTLLQRNLEGNIYASLARVVLGFGLATVVGIPLGVLCGCFVRLDAFLAPLSIFGRNIPVAALIPLTFYFFGIGEWQKIMFIFIACVAFVVSDTARAVRDVGAPYVDTAYTLGASRWQVILRVLVPLAMPSVFNSLRLLFGLAFGYIMLAELVKFGNEAGGLGDIIETSQRIGPREHIYLVLLIIPLVALLLDRALYWIQKELFPHRYGGAGILNQCVRAVMHGWEDVKQGLKWVVRSEPPAVAETAAPATMANPSAALPPEEKKP